MVRDITFIRVFVTATILIISTINCIQTLRTLKFRYGHFPESDTLCAPAKSLYLEKSTLFVEKNVTLLKIGERIPLNCKDQTIENSIESKDLTNQSMGDKIILDQNDIAQGVQCLEWISLRPLESCHGTSHCRLNLKGEVRSFLLKRNCKLHYFNMETLWLKVEYSCIDENLFTTNQYNISVSRKPFIRIFQPPEVIYIEAYNNLGYDEASFLDYIAFEDQNQILAGQNEQRNGAISTSRYSSINIIMITMLTFVILKQSQSNYLIKKPFR